MSSWMLRASVFPVSHPKCVCRLKHRLNRRIIRVCWGEGFCFSSPVLWTRMNGLSAHFTRVSSLVYQMTLVCVLPFHPEVSVLDFTFFFSTSSFFCFHKWPENHRARFLTSLSENMPVSETLFNMSVLLLWVNIKPSSKVKYCESKR